MKFLLRGSTKLITVSNYQELAEFLRMDSHTETEDLEDFMDTTAERCKLQTGAIISTYNVEEFITDLIENEFITPIQE